MSLYHFLCTFAVGKRNIKNKYEYENNKKS